MDKKKIQAVTALLEKRSGAGSVSLSGEHKALQIPRWSTGIEALDEVLGGGIPRGRIISIEGLESSGKTSLGYWLMRMHEQGVYIPIEGTYDENRVKAMGVQDGQLIKYDAEYGEDAIYGLIQFAKAGIPIGILDSVPACIPKEAQDKIETGSDKEGRRGGVARLFAESLPRLIHICESTGTSVVLINQLRANMKATMYTDQFIAPGGYAIKFYTSIQMRIARVDWIKIPNKNPAVSSEYEMIGMIIKVRIIKNKGFNPYGEVKLPLIFDRGFVSHADIEPIRKELMKKRREQFNV